MSEKEKGKKNRKKTGLGIAIWILAFLIILIVFLVKQEEIKGNFEKSGASALIEKKFGKELSDKKDSAKDEDSGETIIDLTKNLKRSEPVAKSEPKKTEDAKTETATTDSLAAKSDSEAKSEKSDEKKSGQTPKPAEKSESQTARQSQSQQAQNQQIAASQKNQPAEVSQSQKPESQSAAEKKTAHPAQSAPPAPSTIKTKICFVAIDSDGPVVRKEVTRPVEKDSPMADALRLLLAGPSATEAKTGCRSFIPAGSRLLSASVKNGVATLNFSDEFQFNQFGVEGSLAQLMQVVYTATNFGTVNSVQILIEGQKRDYLTEGVWIGSPLGRSSF